MTETRNRLLRTLLQLIVSGALTAVVNSVADGLSPNWKAVVLAVWMLIVTFSQNYLEDTGKITPLLKNTGGDSA